MLKAGVAQKYSLSSLLRLEPLVDNVTQNFVVRVRALLNDSRATSIAKETFDLGKWVQYYAFDAIGAITFNQDLGYLSAGKDHNHVIECLEGGLRYAAVNGQVPQFHQWLLESAFVDAILRYIPPLAKANPVPIVTGVGTSHLLALSCKLPRNA